MEMKPIQLEQKGIKRKSVRVGILDLIANKPLRGVYARAAVPNSASIMPQVIAVWAEQMGHEVHYVTYTGFEDLNRELPDDIEILFISTFTQGAYLAYSISNMFRKQNVVTVLGGPHARSYAEDASNYFDYVLGLTDKQIIHDLLQDFSRHSHKSVLLKAKQQPHALPGVRERWKFIQKTLNKTRFIHVVQMIGSLGCPYTCSFCIDSEVAYQPLPYDQIYEDLIFIQKQAKPPLVAWYDPNFGVRFKDYMAIIEDAVKPGNLVFGAESSLSLLSEPHLKQFKRNNFLVMLPGVESWFDCNNKSKQQSKFGLNKVRSVAEHINLILDYIPYVQTNFIFGLDIDSGPLPFDLTKTFIDLVPGVYPNFSLLTDYGNSSPLSRQHQFENRVLDIPFSFLDGYSAMNVKLKNYSDVEFYDYLIDLIQYAHSPHMIWRRFKTNKSRGTKWVNFLRSITSEKGVAMAKKYKKVRHLLTTDSEFNAFYAGENRVPPSFYTNTLKKELGPFCDSLPEKVLSYLDRGEPAPNPRISNGISKGIQIGEVSHSLKEESTTEKVLLHQ
jgi:hypothetical protein